MKIVMLFTFAFVQSASAYEGHKSNKAPTSTLESYKFSKNKDLKNELLQSSISGKVTNSLGNPLQGVSVVVKGTDKETLTDIRGDYVLSISSKEILTFSYMGFETHEEQVENRKVVDVVLKEFSKSLDEVVVIGYGQVKKEDMTGSVSQVNIKDLAKAPVSSFIGTLAGRAAGVRVSSADGQPGQGFDIIIRGANSLTQSNAPLYVVDGFELESQESMNAINTNDIASISILKDASATAIYGSRAANGVVLIETKKGIEGRPAVDYNGSFGFQRTNKTMELMNAYDFVKYQMELFPDFANRYYLDSLGKTLEDYRNVESIDWQNLLFSETPIHTHSLSVRGGTKETKYSISGSVFDQEGIITNSAHRRYQGRLSLEQNINRKIKTGITVNYSDIENNGATIASGVTGSSSSYALYNIWGARPVVGNLNVTDLTDQLIDPDAISAIDMRINPIINAENEINKNRIVDIITNGFLEYKIIPSLTFRSNLAYSTRKNRRDLFYNTNTARGTPLFPSNTAGVNGTVSFAESYSWSNSNFLTYNKMYNKIHNVNIMGGFTVQGSNSSNYGYSSQQISNEELKMNGLSEGVLYNGVSSESYNRLASFLTRFNYTYKNRYLFTLTGRADGSSKFSSSQRWGYFPSGAFAWKLHEEPFFKSFAVISEAKFRISYGITGNNRLGDFSYLPSLNFSVANNYSFGNEIPMRGVRISDVGNADLKWESTRQFDMGFDLGLFKNRISLNLDVYRKNTSDLLLWANLPRTTGFTRAYKNIGSVQNEGLEITLNTVNIRKNDFSWESSFNISFNRNKLLGLNEGETSMQSGVNWEYNFNNSQLYLAKVGASMAQFYSYIFDGVYQNEDFDEITPGKYVLKATVPTNGNDRGVIQPGDIRYKDINGDGVITDYDRGVIGRTLPKHFGGLSNTINYKGVGLHFFFQWSYGNDIFNANRLMLEGNALSGPLRNQFASYNDRWTPDNPSNTLFRARGAGPIGYYSSRVIEDGSFLRLKTTSLSYSIPKRLFGRLNIKDLTVNLTAENLITWTNYSGMDPEVSTRNSALTPGFDWAAYPRAKTIVFGINISL